MTITWQPGLTATDGDDLGISNDAADKFPGIPEGPDRFVGLKGNDTLLGNGGDDSIRGDSDDDSIEGGTGNDSVFGGEGKDIIRGDRGSDWLLGETGDDTLYGGEENDSIQGGQDRDTIYGEAGDDRLYGETGDDYVDSGVGNDLIQGNAGDDTLYGGDNNDDVDGGGGGDFLCGGLGDDTLKGNIDDDYIYGHSGDDYLNGSNGNDSLNGGDDNDQLLGGSGSDIIKGGPGNDTLHGDGVYGGTSASDGEDYFFLARGEGTDTIVGGGFEDTKDKFYLPDGLTYEQLVITQSAGNTLISTADTNEILVSITDVDASLIGSDDFISLPPESPLSTSSFPIVGETVDALFTGGPSAVTTTKTYSGPVKIDISEEHTMTNYDPLTGLAKGDPIAQPYAASTTDNPDIIWEVNGSFSLTNNYTGGSWKTPQTPNSGLYVGPSINASDSYKGDDVRYGEGDYTISASGDTATITANVHNHLENAGTFYDVGNGVTVEVTAWARPGVFKDSTISEQKKVDLTTMMVLPEGTSDVNASAREGNFVASTSLNKPNLTDSEQKTTTGKVSLSGAPVADLEKFGYSGEWVSLGSRTIFPVATVHDNSTPFRGPVDSTANVTYSFTVETTPAEQKEHTVVVFFSGWQSRLISPNNNAHEELIKEIEGLSTDPNKAIHAKGFGGTIWQTEQDQALAYINEFPEDSKIIIAGASWGGDNVIELADALKGQGRNVDLTVQIDSVGLFDDLLPSNVKQGINYWQYEQQIPWDAKTREQQIKEIIDFIPGKFVGDIKQGIPYVEGAININVEKFLNKPDDEIHHYNMIDYTKDAVLEDIKTIVDGNKITRQPIEGTAYPYPYPNPTPKPASGPAPDPTIDNKSSDPLPPITPTPTPFPELAPTPTSAPDSIIDGSVPPDPLIPSPTQIPEPFPTPDVFI